MFAKAVLTTLVLFGIVIPVIPAVLWCLARGVIDDIKKRMEVR